MEYASSSSVVLTKVAPDRRTSWLHVMAAAIVVLNLVDAVMTLAVVHAGAATEANPLMAASLSAGSVWFMLTKLGLVSMGVLLLWRLRESIYAAMAITSLTGVYTLIFFYHFKSMSALVSTL